MLTNRRQARDYLNNLPLSTFWQVVNEAKVTDTDKEILDLRFVHGWPIAKIAKEKFISEDRIKAIIATNYDKISRLI